MYGIFPPPLPFFSSPVVYSEQVNKLSIHSKSPGDFTCGGKIKKKKESEGGGKKKKNAKNDFLAKACTKFPGSPRSYFFRSEYSVRKKAYEK